MIKLVNFFKGKPKPTSETLDIFSKNEELDLSSKSQRQATQDIIEDTPFTYNYSIEELSDIAKDRSGRLYEERQQRLSKFNPFEIKATISSSPEPLSSTERYFLKQMHGQNVNNPTVYAYWTYEYAIDFEEIMTKLIINGYLQLSDIFFDVDSLTVNQLKDILRKYNIKLSGKKEELKQRLYKNVPIDEISLEISPGNKKYMLTSLGKEAVSNLPDSITKNLELEDLCLKHIYSYDFDIAYKLICENELKKIIPRGLGLDWHSELSKGLSAFKIELFHNFLNDVSTPIPFELMSYSMELKACTILGIFFGVNALKTASLFNRIASPNNIPKSEIVATIQDMSFRLLEAIQAHSIYNM